MLTLDFFSAPSINSPDPPTMLSTNPTQFTPEKYDDAWERVDLERSYKNLYREYIFLSVQLSRATRPFGRERTIHNLLNARLKLEHHLKSLKNKYREQQTDLQRNQVGLKNEPPTDEVNYDIVAELRKELQSSKDTLEDVLNGINQSQDTSGTVRLMNDIVQLRVEKIKLLERLTDLEKKKRDLEKVIDKTEIGNMLRHTRLDEEEDEDRAQLRLLLNQSMDECETLKKRVEYYAELLG
jgi:chromosome segregation ATPase